jgi:predicted nucleic acid-binding protein
VSSSSRGLAWKPNPKVRARLEEFVDAFCELVPVSEVVARQAGLLRGELQNRGITCSQADALIAATAEVERLTLVTRNVNDFKDCRIPLLNPFS